MDTLYPNTLLRLAADADLVGPLVDPHVRVEGRSVLCGSTMTLDARFEAETRRLAALGWRIDACAIGRASTQIMAENAIGWTGDDARKALAGVRGLLSGDDDALPHLLHRDVLAAAAPYRARHGSALMPWKALVAAFEEGNR